MLQNPCPRCGGKGDIPTPNGSMYQQCPTCGGSGKDPGVEIPFQYVFDIVLTSGQTVNSVGVTTLGEADFVWKMTSGTQTGAYRIRFGFGGGGYMSSGGQGATNDKVNNANIIGTAQFPMPIFPYVVVPKSGKILFDLEDLSIAGNTIQIAFIGSFLYPSN